MTEDKLWEIVSKLTSDIPVLAVLAWGWVTERRARVEAEKRERAVLRELADCPPIIE